MRSRPDFFTKQNELQARLIKKNAPKDNFFDWILIGNLSYSARPTQLCMLPYR